MGHVLDQQMVHTKEDFPTVTQAVLTVEKVLFGLYLEQAP